jgi:hypothetical protein
MLEMKAVCERCSTGLPLDAANAMICSFECTFCTDCAGGALGGICPNCGGGLVSRPRRAAG